MYFVYGPEGLPIEQITGSTTDYFLHDNLGSTRALLSSSGGVEATFNYSAYGLPSESSGSTTTPLLFDGYFYDNHSGLYYLQNRFYDPMTGQFMTVDPLVSLTAAPYSYAGDDPTNLTDPTGEVTLNDCYSAGGSALHIAGSLSLCFNFGKNGYSVTTTEGGGLSSSAGIGGDIDNSYGLSGGYPMSECSCKWGAQGSASFYSGIGGTVSGSRSCNGSWGGSGGLGVGGGAGVSGTVTHSQVIGGESWGQLGHDWYETVFHPSTDIEGLEGWL